MAGRRQHHIPRLYLRGFLMGASGSTEKVCVYREGREPYISPIEFVAAERDFNSPPSLDGTETLDDRFTAYENSRLAPTVQALRGAAIGSVVEPAIAAEVIAHLSLRTSHLRALFQKGMSTVMHTAKEIFSDSSVITRYLSLDGLTMSDQFRTSVVEELYRQSPVMSSLGPRPFMEQLAFWFVRENFDHLFASQIPHLLAAMKGALERSPTFARDGHIKAMTSGIVPPIRVRDLATYSWRIEAAPAAGAILPDCVAIAYDVRGQAAPYILTPKDELTTVVLPLTAAMLLVGKGPSASAIDLKRLNQDLAACSYDFFVSATQAPEYAELHQRIRERASITLDDALASAVTEFRPKPKGLAMEPASAEEELPSADARSRSNTPNFSYEVRLFDVGDSDVVRKVADILNPIVAAVAQELPLSRLDGFTFANDPLAALRELDRGFDTKSLGEIGEQTVDQYGQPVLVVRDGFIKSRIICHASLAANLLDDANTDMVQWTVYILVRLVATVAITEMIDEVFPQTLLNPISDEYESQFGDSFMLAPQSYFTSYCAAGRGDSKAVESYYERCLIAALDQAQSTILDARRASHANGDIGIAAAAAFNCVCDILCWAAALHGHCDGLNSSSLMPGEILGEKLKQVIFSLGSTSSEKTWKRFGFAHGSGNPSKK